MQRWLAFVALTPWLACGGQTGTPAAPVATDVDSLDATVPDAAPFEASAPVPVVTLAGTVVAGATAAGVAGAFVVAELGGLGGVPPGLDGGATTAGDPFIRYVAVTDDAGEFSLRVPAGTVGLHTLAIPYAEGKENVVAVAAAVTVDAGADGATDANPQGGHDAGSLDGATGAVRIALVASPTGDATPVARPTATRLTPSALYVAPLATITFAVDLAASGHDDPLSGDLFLLQPDTRWAGALAPPTPVVPSGPYPDGDYSLLVTAPATPDAYLYTVVVASRSGATSLPVSVLVTVTPTGAPPEPDGGPVDAGDGGDLFVDGGGVPDGRH